MVSFSSNQLTLSTLPQSAKASLTAFSSMDHARLPMYTLVGLMGYVPGAGGIALPSDAAADFFFMGAS